jgi:hypothetical protein
MELLLAETLARMARKHSITLRQSYRRVARAAQPEAAHLHHGGKFWQAEAHMRRLRTWLGRLARDITCKIDGDVLDVSQSGYFSWKSRPACRRQRDDMVLLAYVRSAFALSNGTYGSPRMVQELRDNGLTVGRRRSSLAQS